MGKERTNSILKAERLSMMKAMQEPAPVLDFVLPGLLVGDVGLIVSPGATGKSFVSLQIGAAITGGLPLLGGAWAAPEHTGRVLVLAFEDSKKVLQIRQKAVMEYLRDHGGATENQLEMIDERLDVKSMKGTLGQIMDANGQPGNLLEELLEAAEDYRLVILDPLSRLHGADENDNGKMTRLVTVLEHAAQHIQSAILLPHHANKAAAMSGRGDMQQAARGGSGLVDGARCVYTLQTMTLEEAEEYNVDDEMRRFWVRLAVPKANYLSPQSDAWLRRREGGVLAHAQLLKGKRKSESAPRPVRKNGAV
jgi:RecA-family ATPase